jgi:sulfatase maturation enzyme AslB (radical SAM superfamily)
MHRTVFIKTTEACQLNCKHCFTTGNKPPRNYIDGIFVADWIKRFVEHLPADSMHFELHGGEPFLAPPILLNWIVDHIRLYSPWASVGATTNLTYALTDELLEFMTTKLNSRGTKSRFTIQTLP